MVFSQGCQRPFRSAPCRQIKHEITFINSPSSVFKAFGGELPSVLVPGRLTQNCALGVRTRLLIPASAYS